MDNQVFNSDDFAQYLLFNRFIKSGTESFYVHWVRLFFQKRVSWPERPWFDQLLFFITNLQEEGSLHDWQIRQAEQAVRLYFSNYLQHKNPSPGSQNALIHLDQNGVFRRSDAINALNESLRLRNYSNKTITSYVNWCNRFFTYIQVQQDTHSGDRLQVSPKLVRDYLAHLAVKANVSASTQNLCFNALQFFFRHILNDDIGELKNAVRAQMRKRLPVVFSVEETRTLLNCFEGTQALIMKLIYGSGLRISECVHLRVQDLDFDQGLVRIMSGKGNKDRTSILPDSLRHDMKNHLGRIIDLHQKDLNSGHGEVWLPDSLKKKYPFAAREIAWQWVFPQKKLSFDPESHVIRRHHVSTRSLQKVFKTALKRSEIYKHATIHTLRHSFATHLLLSGVDIRQIQEYLGHTRVETTMIYTHVIKDMRDPVVSPLDNI